MPPTLRRRARAPGKSRDRLGAGLDGYDLGGGARPLPFLSEARVQASRSWQIAVDGATATTTDRIDLWLTPLLAVGIQTDTHSQPEERAWFTQLRWRVKLGK